MPHPTLGLEVALPGSKALDLRLAVAAAASPSPGPMTRSAMRSATSSAGGKTAKSKWSRPLPHSAAHCDSLPPSRYSPYAAARERRKSPRSITTRQTSEAAPQEAGMLIESLSTATAAATSHGDASVHAPPPAPLVGSPLTAMAARLEGMSMTWPVSSCTRSRARGPSRLPQLDASERLSADLLTLVPGSAPDLPRRGPWTAGRRASKLEPLPPDACPNSALLGLAGLEDL